MGCSNVGLADGLFCGEIFGCKKIICLRSIKLKKLKNTADMISVHFLIASFLAYIVRTTSGGGEGVEPLENLGLENSLYKK